MIHQFGHEKDYFFYNSLFIYLLVFTCGKFHPYFIASNLKDVAEITPAIAANVESVSIKDE